MLFIWRDISYIFIAYHSTESTTLEQIIQSLCRNVKDENAQLSSHFKADVSNVQDITTLNSILAPPPPHPPLLPLDPPLHSFQGLMG